MVKTRRPRRKKARKNSLRDADKELIRQQLEKQRREWRHCVAPMFTGAREMPADVRRRYEIARQKLEPQIKKMVDAVRASQHITHKDLAIIVT